MVLDPRGVLFESNRWQEYAIPRTKHHFPPPSTPRQRAPFVPRVFRDHVELAYRFVAAGERPMIISIES